MCGLAFGITTEYSDEFFIRCMELGLFAQFRGYDSAGIYLYNSETKEEAMVKTLGAFAGLWGTKRLRKAVDNIKPNVVFIHARAATIGVVDIANCQPVALSGVTMMHNGTINTLGDKLKNVSDSRELAAILNTEGSDVYDDVFEPYLETGAGAAALVWLDKADHTVNLLRNSKRPFALMPTRNDEMIFGASEIGMLEAYKKRGTQVHYDDPFNLPVNTHVVFDIDDDFKISGTDMGTTALKGMPVRVKAPYAYTRHDRSGHGSMYSDVYGSSYTKPAVSAPSSLDANKSGGKRGAVVPFRQASFNYRGPRGAYFTEKRGDELLAKGCASCGAQVADTKETVYWIGQIDEHVCADCYKDRKKDANLKFISAFHKSELLTNGKG